MRINKHFCKHAGLAKLANFRSVWGSRLEHYNALKNSALPTYKIHCIQYITVQKIEYKYIKVSQQMITYLTVVR